jgi:hypothetical protein
MMRGDRLPSYLVDGSAKLVVIESTSGKRKASHRYCHVIFSGPAIYGDPMRRTNPDVTQWLISNGTGA